MPTLKLKHLLVVPFLTILFSTSVFSADKLSILLQQAVDTNCDGIITTPYSSLPIQNVSPQQCVMYKISVKNISQEQLYNIVIHGNIPPNTQLLARSISFYKSDKLLVNNVAKSAYSAQINSQPITLSSQKIVTLLYSIRVN
ncbi:MAG TPA: hypothetical protein EYG68_11915 [Leucothrix mucor]|nr:hypothetical protein [Leucothrix mucor]